MLRSLLNALYKMHILSPKGIATTLSYLSKHGVNLMLLLYLANKMRGNQVALIDDQEKLTYSDLYKQSHSIAAYLREQYNLHEKQKVAFLCHNHASFIRYLFAASRLGATIYLLNTAMSAKQFNQQNRIHKFDLVILDPEFTFLMKEAHFSNKRIISTKPVQQEISSFSLPKSSSSRIVLLTGGTTGSSKEVVHQPSVTNFLPPFLALIERLKLPSYHTAYIATPIFHGYGIAILLVFFALGKKIVITKKFHPEKACQLIKTHQVQVITVVPLMVYRLLETNKQALAPLRCIASGGARISPILIERTKKALGDVLYNLYGTSEAGLNLIATPRDLALSPETIGRPIKGTTIKIVDEEGAELSVGSLGQLCFQNKWSMKNKTDGLIQSGDLGYKDENGLFYLKGRQDEMVISAGQNIYPSEIEHVILTHPSIEDVAVIGIEDEEYGQKLIAYIQPTMENSMSTLELKEWLKPRLAKFQLPREIIFVKELPYSSVGKLQKRKLPMHL